MGTFQSKAQNLENMGKLQSKAQWDGGGFSTGFPPETATIILYVFLFRGAASQPTTTK
jgi:hypothetical protein